MRVVLDANVIVSAAYTFEIPTSGLAHILRTGIRGRYTLLTSEHILNEAGLAISKPFFVDRVSPWIIREVFEGIRAKALKVELTQSVEGVATHWQDDLVLSTALSGDAELLVTGDRELLELDHPYPFQIIHPHEFLAILEGGSDDAE